MLLTDQNGSAIGFLDGESVRDENGKVVLSRASDDATEYRLARLAAASMNGTLSDQHRPSLGEMRKCNSAEERQVLLDLAVGDVVTQSGRGFAALAANDAGCIADEVSGVRLVSRDRGYLWVENVQDAVSVIFPNAGAPRAAPVVNPQFTKIAFSTYGYNAGVRISRATAATADFDVLAAATRMIIENLRIAREMRVATLTMATGGWATANQISATAKWNGGATADPLIDLFAARGASYLPANKLVLPESAEPYFFSMGNANAVTSIRDFVQAGGKLPTIVRARARYLSGGSLKYIWAPTTPTNVALVRAPTDPIKIPTSATMRWLGDEKLDHGRRVDGFFVRSWFDQRGAFGSDCITVVHNDAELQVSSTVGSTTTKCQVGALITGALA